MKQTIEIEIQRPSKAPTCFSTEPETLPEGAKVEVHIIDGLWEGAVFNGKLVAKVLSPVSA